MRFRSTIGLLLALLYGLAFAGSYGVYWFRAGQWLADLPVVTIAIPFTTVMTRLLGEPYLISGDMTGRVVAAAAFGCGAAYVVGWVVAQFIRLMQRGFGWLLALLYGLAFVGSYFAYWLRAEDPHADWPVVAIATPYTAAMTRLFGEPYSLSGDMTGRVVAAAAFGCVSAFVLGWIVALPFRLMRREK